MATDASARPGNRKYDAVEKALIEQCAELSARIKGHIRSPY